MVFTVKKNELQNQAGQLEREYLKQITQKMMQN